MIPFALERIFIRVPEFSTLKKKISEASFPPSHTTIAPYLAIIVVEQKELWTGHTNYPTLNHFSRKVSKPNSDYLKNLHYPTDRSVAWLLH